jgi:hypothetical protein
MIKRVFKIFKKWTWKVATIVGVWFLLANPELWPLAFFVDAVGLELFLVLIQVQIVAVSGYYFHRWVKPALMPLYRCLLKIDPYFFIPSKNNALECPVILCHAIPFLMVFMLLI